MDDTTTHFEPGQLIFEEDSIGDAMFLIKQGSVEIFKKNQQRDILLTVQNAGELIGIFTFFNRGRRLASARARTHVIGQLIKRTEGQDPLQNLPAWVQAVIRDFSLRIEQINDQFAKSVHHIHELEKKAMDPIRMSIQIADCFAELGGWKAQKMVDGRELIPLRSMVDLLTACLGYEREQLESILEIFKKMGLLKVELDPDGRNETISLTAALRLKWYADFVRSTRSGKNKRLLNIHVSFRNRKQLFALREYAQEMGADLNKTYKEEFQDFGEFKTKFEAKTKIALEQSALDDGIKLGLIEFKVGIGKSTISFHPTFLVRTLVALNVLRQFKLAPGTEDTASED